MSRSTRKPFYYRVCCGPVQTDRTLAARAVRRRHRRELGLVVKHQTFDEVLLSHRYECPYNDRWTWNCDGHAIYQSTDPHRYHRTWIGIYLNSDLDAKSCRTSKVNNRYWLDYHIECIEHDRKLHQELKRK